MELLTVPEAAARLKLGKSTVYLLAQQGMLPVVRIGRAVRLPAQALEDWLQRQTQAPADLQ